MAHIDPDREAWAAFKALPQDRPVQMLNLIRLRALADYPPEHPDHGKGLSGREAYGAYARELRPMLEQLGARQVWAGRPEATLIGPETERWDLAFIIEYPSAAAFIAMLADPAYRDSVRRRTAAVADSRLVRMAPLGAEGRLGE